MNKDFQKLLDEKRAEAPKMFDQLEAEAKEAGHTEPEITAMYLVIAECLEQRLSSRINKGLV